MEFAYQIILLIVSLVVFRWVFSLNDFKGRFWKSVGRKISKRFFLFAWIIMATVVVIIVQTFFEAVISNELLAKVAYILSFSACFALMPGLEIRAVNR